jgi:hypothetical protein
VHQSVECSNVADEKATKKLGPKDGLKNSKMFKHNSFFIFEILFIIQVSNNVYVMEHTLL